MPKLHELLAAETPLANQATKTRTDLLHTFDKKKTHFEKRIVTFTPVGENEKPTVEDQLDLQTTVKKELEWIGGILSNYMDTSYKVDVANTQAKASIVLDDDTVLAKDVPATALLRLEHRMGELLGLVQAIPTLDPVKGFAPDPSLGADIYRSRPEVKTRTKKVQRVLTLAPATDKHPAQAQVVSEDVEAGKIETVAWSGLLTTAEKAEMLERVEKLSVAVKKARSRANEQAVPDTKIASALLNYVFKGVTA